jgi:hypothetical protein
MKFAGKKEATTQGGREHPLSTLFSIALPLCPQFPCLILLIIPFSYYM